jgi:hypothetical protein
VLFAPFILLYLVVAVGVLIFVMIWTVGRARQDGRAAMMTTIGIWATVGLLTTVAGAAWFMVNWRSPVAASPEQLTGYWESESPDGTATIELRPDGSAIVGGVPSVAAWSIDWMDEVPDLPAVLSGEGLWEAAPFEEVEFTCSDGQTLRLLWQTVESPTGAMYLQFIAGDPDTPRYFGEFSRVESSDVPNLDPASKLAC